MFRGVEYTCPKEIKQNLNQIVGKLIPKPVFIKYANNLVNFEKIGSDSKKLFIALETLLEINFTSKAYLLYITSNIESMIYTWFYHLINEDNTLKETKLKNIPDEFWLNYFRSKKKFNDFKYRFSTMKNEDTFEETIKNGTLGTYVFILSRFRKEYVQDFFNNKNDNLDVLVKSLKIAKNLRNFISHSSFIINENEFKRILKNSYMPKNIEGNAEILKNIFDNLDKILKNIGYNNIQKRLSSHIKKDLDDKNKYKFRKDKKIEFNHKYLKIDWFF